ncbi:MAG: HAMP domain-containing sensor histidine kinase [Archangium sp.]
MNANAERLSLDALEEAALDRLFERGLALRLYMGPVIFLSIIVLLAWDATPWRRWILLSIVSIAVIRLAYEGVRALRQRPDRTRLASLLPIPATGLACVIACSGGVDSPIAVMAPIITVFLSMFLRPRVGVIVAVVFTVLLWSLAVVAHNEWVATLVPELFGGGPRVSNDSMLFSRVVLLTLGVGWAALMGDVMRNAFRSATQRALDARDEVLKTHEESTRALTTMTAEIAHELKNPLASVKGLAALLAREAEGKNQERLTVLRREVDRMQEILESFLTFTRPMVPLQVDEVPLKELVEQVVALHEGMAHERGVELRVDARELSVKADSRKLKQVMINLVQNALDVTPRDGAIDLVVRAEPNGAALLVMDRGLGVADSERLFEAGVTTKATGSGLGLTVSRLLARQHGGDVKLLPRDGGGTIAELVLPASPVLTLTPPLSPSGPS